MAHIRRHLTYANGMATVAVFLALGGGAYAALKRNSVGSKQIKPNAVKGIDANEATFGQVPSAANADHLDDFDSSSFLRSGATAGGALDGSYPNPTIKPPDAAVTVLPDTSSCPDVWADLSPDVNNETGYYRDPLGRVHLQGVAVQCGNPGDTIFTLPPGFRPAKLEHFGTVAADAFGALVVDNSGNVIATAGSFHTWISLDGLSFRCAPSGSDGCP